MRMLAILTNVLIALQWLTIAKAADADSEKLLLIPDQMRISERFHQPQFSIEKMADGFKVKLSYAADTDDLSQYLFQLYGPAISSKEIYEAELLPLRIRHFSSLFEEKTIVKSWRATFQLNEVHLEYFFTQDLTEEQIQNVFAFGYVLASVDVELQCSGQITARLCDQTLAGIPLINQYALAANATDAALFSDYSELGKYVSFVRLGRSFLNLTSLDEVDGYLKQTLFSGSQCRPDLDGSATRICALITKHSQSQSIKDSIQTLTKRLFQERPVDASRNFYILDGSQFSTTNEGPVGRSKCSVFDAFCPLSP
ncbi:MAG: hypothetical protein ACOVS5_08495 [Oligoflexus sp.]|jgi:hypothetical protein